MLFLLSSLLNTNIFRLERGLKLLFKISPMMFDGLFNVNFMRRKRTFDFSRHTIFIFFYKWIIANELEKWLYVCACVSAFVCVHSSPRSLLCFVLFSGWFCLLFSIYFSVKRVLVLLFVSFDCFFTCVCVLITCYRYQYIFFSMLNVLPMHSLKTNSLQLISLHANG